MFRYFKWKSRFTIESYWSYPAQIKSWKHFHEVRRSLKYNTSMKKTVSASICILSIVWSNTGMEKGHTDKLCGFPKLWLRLNAKDQEYDLNLACSFKSSLCDTSFRSNALLLLVCWKASEFGVLFYLLFKEAFWEFVLLFLLSLKTIRQCIAKSNYEFQPGSVLSVYHKKFKV